VILAEKSCNLDDFPVFHHRYSSSNYFAASYYFQEHPLDTDWSCADYFWSIGNICMVNAAKDMARQE
jgi:hypothetical protein